MTAGLAAQQQARPACRAARQSMESGPRHCGSDGPDDRCGPPRPVKLGCMKFADMLLASRFPAHPGRVQLPRPPGPTVRAANAILSGRLALRSGHWAVAAASAAP